MASALKKNCADAILPKGHQQSSPKRFRLPPRLEARVHQEQSQAGEAGQAYQSGGAGLDELLRAALSLEVWNGPCPRGAAV